MRLSYWRAKICIFFAFAGGVAPAQELFSWHTAEASTRLNSRASITFHTRIRTRQSFEHIAQVRAGALLGFNLAGFGLTAGYYVEPNHPLDSEWQSGHRFTSSLTRSIPLQPKLTITPRANFDRFFTVVRGNFNRYRPGVRWDYGLRHGPYLINEVMFVADGFHSTRNTAGWRFRPAPHWQFEAGYVYDVRKQYWGGNRQAVITVMRYQFGE